MTEKKFMQNPDMPKMPIEEKFIETEKSLRALLNNETKQELIQIIIRIKLGKIDLK